MIAFPISDIEALAAGDHKVFRQLFDASYMELYRFVNAFLQNVVDTETVVADVYCLLWEKRHLLSEVEKLEPYLYKICRNEASRFLKDKAKRRTDSIENFLVDIPLSQESIIDKVSENEMMEVYRKTIDTLPERCRQVFVLVREKCMSHKEVSEIMGITTGTIEIQMNIAIKRITAEIKKVYPHLIPEEK